MSNNASTRFVTKQLSDIYDYLAPDGSEIRLLAQGNKGGLCHCALPVGGISQAVKHQQVEEIWYCISGTGQIWRKYSDGEGKVTDIYPGTSLTIPADVHFQFQNIGTSPLCILIVTMPPWPGPQEAVHVPNHWTTVSEGREP